MEKIWHTAPLVEIKITKTYPEYQPVILQLLFNRDLTDKEAIAEFMNPDYKNSTHDPFLFKQMAAATALIIKHIKAKNKIVVYGDYDADGVTASALLTTILRLLKANVEVYIPDRVAEGYGLNKKALTEIAKAGANLIITVDGGIRNKDEVAFAQEQGIEVVITDHHIPPRQADELPACLIVNPFLAGENYPEKNLSGVGVAFKLALAIIRQSKLAEETKQKLEYSLLDFVAIGTVADCVSLLGENRILVKEGLRILADTKRLGLIELKKVSGGFSGQDISAWQIGFQLAPRLNAAGRMDHANTALELLITKDKSEAEDLAKRLNESNVLRQKDTEEIMIKVEEQVDPNSEDKIIIGICHLDGSKEQRVWNEGVIGLAAGKIADKYSKPALVITQTDEGYKGSGRSMSEFNLIAAIEECGEYLNKFGGHKSAAGFSLAKEKLPEFIAKIKRIAAAKLSGLDLSPKIFIDAELALSKINEDIVNDLKKFEPLGQDNWRPKFVSYGARVVDIINMGIDGQHLKLRLQGDNSKIFSALGFGQATIWKHIKIGDIIDTVYYLEFNEYNGRCEIQLKIVDIKSHNS